MTNITHQATSQTIAHSGYSMDVVGNRTGQTGTTSRTYAYDNLDRLTSATGGTAETFTYDAVGNRLTGPATTDKDYLYNAGNQALKGRQLNYAYDNSGNPTHRTSATDPTKNWLKTWDAENRLTKMEKANGDVEVTFTYDPFGRRITKKTDTVTGGVTSTTTYHYLYDNDDIAAEFMTNSTGTTQTIYTHGPNIDEPLALERNGSYAYYHADGLGSVVSITDQARNIVQKYTYDSFGGLTASTAFRNSFTFTAREYDEETGLYFYRARYYDPRLGRFLSVDPIGFYDDVNLYGYVGNNPINYIDPWGLARTTVDCAIEQAIRQRNYKELEALLEIANPKQAELIRRILEAARQAQSWLGKDYKVITNKAGDKIFISRDGTRRIRFDINNPSPHKNPHSHVEQLVNGKWVKSGPIYPRDVPKF